MQKNCGHGTRRLAALACAVVMTAWCGAKSLDAATWRMEVEKVGNGAPEHKLVTWKPLSWKVEKMAGASEGAVLSGAPEAETHSIPTLIPHAGVYKVWVRYLHTPGKFTSFGVLFRDDIGEGVNLHFLDFRPRLMTALPPKDEEAPKDAKPSLVWESYDAVFERPTSATLSIVPASGLCNAKIGIDCVIVTDEAGFDPEKTDIAQLPADPGVPMTPVASPRGMKPAAVITPHASFFAGESDPKKQLKMGLLIQSLCYRNYSWLVQLGSNFDHGWCNGSTRHGIHVEAVAETATHFPKVAELAKKYPSPEGRFVNAAGKVGNWSWSFEPYRKAYLADMAEGLSIFKEWETVETYMVISETGGFPDYGPDARGNFHRYLAERFGTIEKLNGLWRTQYKSFDEVTLPQPAQEKDNKAAWFAFRDFNSKVMAGSVADKARMIREIDPKRHAASQSSCLHINAPAFTAPAVLDYEDLLNIGFTGEPEFGMDSYSALDSFCGCDMDYVLSLTQGRRMVNSEFNVHSHDPRDMARSYWAQIGKGLKGIMTWAMNSTADNWMYVMWGLVNNDDTPRDKLGVVADANHEVHRLERILGSAKSGQFVKPVALYFSRMDLSIPQPVFGLYSTSFNSPYRVYSVLRGLGYPVRWVTPKQIVDGQLQEIGAVVMVGVKYVPMDAAAKLADWVQQGGCVIGDQWPGALDEYDRTQDILLNVFGIRPLEVKAAATKEKAKQEFETAATPVGGGIDPEVLRTLNQDELFKRVEETWAQWDSTHPVAKAVGNWHICGFDLKKIKVLSGEIIGMGMGGSHAGIPSMTINSYGKGHALYSAMMLGTMYESGPVAFEFDSGREGRGFPAILDAYLRYCGVEPLAETGLPERASWRMRIEVPQVDEKGNVIICMTSQNDMPLASLPLSIRWPDSAPRPRIVFACVGGTRQMQKLPFELKDGKLKVTMPGFDASATLLALVDSEPLISTEITGVARKVGGMLDVSPGTRLKIKVTVWNPSDRKLSSGKVSLYTAPGWFADQPDDSLRSISAFDSRSTTFEVAAPAICAKRSLKPITFKYEAGDVRSTPCTEIVWWSPSNPQ